MSRQELSKYLINVKDRWKFNMDVIMKMMYLRKFVRVLCVL